MNSLDAITEILEPIAPTVFHVKEDEPIPYIHLKQLPGIPTGRSWETIDRIEIAIFAEGYDPAKDLSDEAAKVLTGPAKTSFGPIDLIQAEVPLFHDAIESDTLNMFSGTYLITYRH